MFAPPVERVSFMVAVVVELTNVLPKVEEAKARFTINKRYDFQISEMTEGQSEISTPCTEIPEIIMRPS